MGDMKMIGPGERAKQMRAAAVRVRREVEVALPPHNARSYQLHTAVSEIAETMAVLANIMRLLDERLPEEQRASMTDEMRRSLLLYREYHQVMR